MTKWFTVCGSCHGGFARLHVCVSQASQQERGRGPRPGHRGVWASWSEDLLFIFDILLKGSLQTQGLILCLENPRPREEDAWCVVGRGFVPTVPVTGSWGQPGQVSTVQLQVLGVASVHKAPRSPSSDISSCVLGYQAEPSETAGVHLV